MRSEDEIRDKIKAMKERGYQSYEYGNFLDSEVCFAFADGKHFDTKECYCKYKKGILE